MRLILVALFLFSCGIEPSNEVVDNRDPGSNGGGAKPGPNPPKDEWNGVQSIIKEQCSLSGCHAGAKFLATGRAFKTSSSAQLIRNDRMPKPQSINFDLWTDEKKAILLKYLGG